MPRSTFRSPRRQASVQAVRNAKHTAEDIARTVGLHVAKAVHIVEEHYQEKEGSSTTNGASVQHLIDTKTITVHVTLNVTFDLKAKERHRHKEKASA